MKSQSGFTLMELLAVIVIASILAALAAPSMRGMVQDNRITTATNTLISHLALARSEAITRRQTVVLCRSALPLVAVPVCGGGTATDWSTGWLLFANVSADEPPTYDGGGGVNNDVLIKIGEGVTGNLTLFSNADAEPHVEYDIDGTSTVAIGNIASFAICDSRGEGFGRQIDIDELGRVDLTRADPGDPLVDCTTP